MEQVLTDQGDPLAYYFRSDEAGTYLGFTGHETSKLRLLEN